MHVLLQISTSIIHGNMGNAAIKTSEDEVSQCRCWSLSWLALTVPVLWGMTLTCCITVTELVQTHV